MKQTPNLILWVAVCLAIPILGTLALSQFNWKQELQARERERIESSMLQSSIELTKRLQEEILFLPSILRVRPEDAEKEDPETLFAQRYFFWQFYALKPAMVTEIFLQNGKTGTITQWDGERFVQCLDPDRVNAIIRDLSFHSEGDNKIGDAENEIRVAMPFANTDTKTAMIVFIIDKTILFRELIPEIAAESLKMTNLYAYRIIDGRNGGTVFSTVSAEESVLFSKPDLELPVIEELMLPVFQHAPTFDGGPGGFVPGRPPARSRPPMAFIKERAKLDRTRTETRGTPRIFSYLCLQIVNRDGTLEEMTRNATITNAVISFLSTDLLIMVLILLVEASRRSSRLALSQREFIATITHELKTPLAVISSAAENLSDGLVRDQSKAVQYGSMIHKEAMRLGVSIEHFLLYSRTNSISRMKPVPCDIAEMVLGTLKFTEEERTLYGFRTETVLPDSPVYVIGDRIALESVFRNLVLNALNHARDGRYLGIQVSREPVKRGSRDGAVVIKIRDRGPGIPAREQKQVFEPFVRGRRAIERQIPGNGIGLNLVRRIIVVHNGTITLESKPDIGSTFIITLPVYKGETDAG